MKYFMRKLGKISAVGLTCFILAGNELGGYACADSWRMPQGAILRCSEDSLGLTLLAGNTVSAPTAPGGVTNAQWIGNGTRDERNEEDPGIMPQSDRENTDEHRL
jgi:hypothetical protein